MRFQQVLCLHTAVQILTGQPQKTRVLVPATKIGPEAHDLSSLGSKLPVDIGRIRTVCNANHVSGSYNTPSPEEYIFVMSVRYSWTVRVSNPVEGEFSAPTQTSRGAHPASYAGDKSARAWRYPLHLIPR